jgi:hemolysin III
VAAELAGAAAARFGAGVAPSRHRSAEQWLDRLLHWVGLAASLAAAATLTWVTVHGSGRAIAGVLVYCVGLLAMIGCSALYHLSEDARRKPLFRRLDHAAIFLLIAATYTPFALDAVAGLEGIGLLAFVWAVAGCGMILKLFKPDAIEGSSIAVYLLLGWSGFALGDRLLSALATPTLVLLAAGGVLYTVGVAFHVWKNLRFQNPIWHGFVLGGAACHFMAVFHEVR